ncbi:MAG: hypothetical protein DI536_28955 [Archangium gephyra]|uniref:Phospholipase D-like domain-containing protein n=1 Tax=Archangium gephyra TaxID=48 RepID=A0A2W5UE01_9BACT|nr:MAG: hypothetical protein DI536_28955 [Archangium gephyra]
MDSYICLQDPDDAESTTTLESILAGCEDATSGGAIFAYASQRGIATLFSDKVFRNFVRRASFDLVVGLDAITTVGSLEQLQEESRRYPKLVARAFLHGRKDGIFHPKFAWFRDADGGQAIVGSGNLTPGGLHGNWEAFSRQKFGLNAAATVETEWAGWKARHQSELRKVSDPEAIARAALNKKNLVVAPDAEDEIFAAPPPPSSDDDVLVAELPKGGREKPRWAQANFNYDTFTSFFHLHPSATRRVVLWHVDSNGKLGQAEIRQSVAVKSQNFRIELEAAHGLAYPDAAPPIVMFRRIGTRRFRYQLLMPDQTDYAKANVILEALWSGSARFMRRVTLSSVRLQNFWPNSPLL